VRGSAGSQLVSIVVCSVPQGAELGRESVNPAKMTLLIDEIYVKRAILGILLV